MSIFDVTIRVTEMKYDPIVFIDGEWKLLELYLPKVFEMSLFALDLAYQFSELVTEEWMFAFIVEEQEEE